MVPFHDNPLILFENATADLKPIILLPASPIEFDFFVVPLCRTGDTCASFHCLILNAAKQPAFTKPDHCRFDFHFAAEEIYNFLNGEIVAEINFMLACGLNKIRVDS